MPLNHFPFFASKEMINDNINLNTIYENKIFYDDSINYDTFIRFMSEG